MENNLKNVISNDNDAENGVIDAENVATEIPVKNAKLNRSYTIYKYIR